MKKYILPFLIVSGTLFMAACGGKDKEHDQDDIDSLTSQDSPFQLAAYVTLDTARHFGKTINAEGATNVQNLAADLKRANGFTGKVSGTVTSVCQNKGCWMTLDTGNGNTMMVTFKDYGFFVPKDLSGKNVVIEGKAEIRSVSVDEQKHLAADAGKPQSEIDKITQPKDELRFVADGVLIK